MTYNSQDDTNTHISHVHRFLVSVISKLKTRALLHDLSKLHSPEKEMFDEFTPKLRELKYGTSEYRKALDDMGPALKHHYEQNTHHPEHYSNGINGMSLLDVIEMLADWKAAGMRHASGDIRESLEINRVRFGIDDQLFQILLNTVKELNW